MSPFIPAAERIQRARKLIQQARDLPVPIQGGRSDFSYIAQVKALLQDARDLVKFIPKIKTAPAEIKEQANQIFLDADQADRDLLKWG